MPVYKSLPVFFEMEDEDIDAMIDINLKGVLFTVAEAAALMRDAGNGGTMVLMASDQALIGKEGSIVYGATKGAVAQMAMSLSMALVEYGIRVKAVCPATVKMPLTDQVFQWIADKHFSGDRDAAWAAEAKTLPLGRVAAPEEIAEVVYFLKPAAVVVVDGGACDGGRGAYGAIENAKKTGVPDFDRCRYYYAFYNAVSAANGVWVVPVAGAVVRRLAVATTLSTTARPGPFFIHTTPQDGIHPPPVA
jgi:hypothetical protein